MEEKKPNKGKGAAKRGLSGSPNLIDFEPDEERPDVMLYALERAHQRIHQSRVDKEGRFEIPSDVLEKSTYIAIAPESEQEMFTTQRAMVYSTHRISELLQQAVFRKALKSKFVTSIPAK